MSETPEEQQQGARKHQPSFEEVLQGVRVEEPKPPAEPKRSAQPTFEEILESVRPSSGSPRPPQQGKSRPPRQKEERRMPIVVRKPTLGAPAPSEPPASTSQPAESAAQKTVEDPGSVYAQPSPEESADFAALFAGSEQQKPGKLRVGQKISARVAHLGAEVAFLDLGGKGEGIIDLRELRNEKGDLLVHAGETLEGYVLSVTEGNVVVTRSVPKGAGREMLQQALDSKIPIEGLVTGQNKGGLEVDLGGMRGFVPASQVDIRFIEDQSQVVGQPGQRVKVQVLRIEKDDKLHEKIALSLRALEQDPWDAARPQLKEGARLQGKVARLQPFGAFVELFPGVDGLVHVSALSDRHVQHPREVVKEGETIWVQVESVDDAQRRIALRRIGEEEAQAPAGPGPEKEKRARVGDVIDATVDKCEPFGVFVHWEGGKGLVPNAELGTPRGSDNKKTLPPGTQFKAQIVDIDDRGRYRLSRSAAERAEGASDYREDHRQMNKRMPPGKGFGTLGDLLRAKLQQSEDE